MHCIAVFCTVVCFCTAIVAACDPEYSGFYDPGELRYRNVAWNATGAPGVPVSLHLSLYKMTPSAPMEVRFGAVVAGSTHSWSSHGFFGLYASPTCDPTTSVDERHFASPDGPPHVSANFTSRAAVSCATQFFVQARVNWDDKPWGVALASDDKTCFGLSVCCVSSGTCAASPHSVCAGRSHCLASGNSVNESVSCSESGSICCVLSPQLPDPNATAVPTTQLSRPASNETALGAYIGASVLGIVLIGVGYYYYEMARSHREDSGFEMHDL